MYQYMENLWIMLENVTIKVPFIFSGVRKIYYITSLQF